jgi:tetratricopeptide (TPR) repeat protein
MKNFFDIIGIRKNIGRRLLLCAMSFLLMLCEPVWADSATVFYQLSLESSMAYKKIEYFTKALELNPEMIEAYKKRGLLYYYQGKYPQTIYDFKKAAKLDPLDTMPLHMLSLTHLKSGNVDEAILNSTLAIELNPQDGSAYCYRSEANLIKGMTAAALKDASKAIELGGGEPIMGRAYAVRSKAYRALGQNRLAEADFSKALALNPDYYVYTLATSTEYLADMAGKSSDVKHVGWMGVALMAALCVVVIFKLALPPPKKDNTR